MELRPYQKTALNKIYTDLQAHPNVLLSAIMGAGKTVMVCSLIEHLYKTTNKHFLILAHKEILVKQFQETLNVPNEDVGICCAGLNEKEIDKRVIIGTVQTFVNLKQKYDWCDLLIIDEIHKVSIDTDSQYDQVITHLRLQRPDMRILGITATPFRDSGYIYGKRHSPGVETLFPKMNHQIKYKELRDDGYLMQLEGLVAMTPGLPQDLESVTARGDYVIDELGAVMCNERHLETAVEAIHQYTSKCKYVCVFCVNIDHAEKVKQLLGDECTIIHSQLTSIEKWGNMAAWKDGRKRIITSVNILTEGFDFPPLDCLVFLRPTLSPGLFLQAVGRVLRTHEDKERAFLLDLTDNTDRFGTNLDKVRVPIPKGYGKVLEKKNEKECPECGVVVHLALRTCSNCGYMWTAQECIVAGTVPHLEIVSFKSMPLSWIKVNGFDSFAYESRKSGKILGKVKLYYDNYLSNISKYFCLPDYYDGYAVERAKQIWIQYSFDPFPDTVDEFIKITLKNISHVLIDFNGEYPEIKEVRACSCWDCKHLDLADEDFPKNLGFFLDCEFFELDL